MIKHNVILHFQEGGSPNFARRNTNREPSLALVEKWPFIIHESTSRMPHWLFADTVHCFYSPKMLVDETSFPGTCKAALTLALCAAGNPICNKITLFPSDCDML